MKRHQDWPAQALRDLRHAEVSLRAEAMALARRIFQYVQPVKRKDLKRWPLARKALEKGVVLAERDKAQTL